MGKVLLQSFNSGGVADSKYSGIKNSWARLIGWDLHSKPGLLQVNQKMTKDSGSTIDQFCKVAVDCSNGIRYWFSATSGKIWQEKNGTYTLDYTTAPAVGGAACLGAYEYQGYIYWATEKRLHRIPIDNSKADGSSAWTTNAAPDWAELNSDQTVIGGTGATAYSLTNAVNEGATHKQTFTPVSQVLEGFAVNVNAKGTSVDWTIALHDSSNNLIASATVLAASVPSSGKMYMTFSSPVPVTPGGTYHVHLYASATTGTPKAETSTNNDWEAGQLYIYTQSDDTYHPMRVVNLVLYIGDRNYLHQVDSGVFSNQAFDIETGYRISALGKMGTDILIGTIIASNVARCEIFRWNGYSDSFSSSDTVQEPGINCFLEADNYVLVNAGLQGNIYSYNGSQLTFYKKIPGTYSPSAQAIIFPYATAMFNGYLPIFGVSSYSGDPCDEGIWSMGRYNPNYPTILNLEFPISQVDSDGYNRVAGVQIGAVIVSGQNVYMSWSYNSGYGVDKLDYSNKIVHPIAETRVIVPQLGGFDTFNKFIATYESMPSGASISFKTSINGASYVALDPAAIKDTDRNAYIGDASRMEARTLQLRMEATSSSNNAPAIQEVIIDVT